MSNCDCLSKDLILLIGDFIDTPLHLLYWFIVNKGTLKDKDDKWSINVEELLEKIKVLYYSRTLTMYNSETVSLISRRLHDNRRIVSPKMKLLNPILISLLSQLTISKLSFSMCVDNNDMFHIRFDKQPVHIFGLISTLDDKYEDKGEVLYYYDGVLSTIFDYKSVTFSNKEECEKYPIEKTRIKWSNVLH